MLDLSLGKPLPSQICFILLADQYPTHSSYGKELKDQDLPYGGTYIYIGVPSEEALPPCSTVSAKSLGTLPVIYAVDEQQNPFPRKTMLCGGDTNSTGGENVVFPRRLGLRLSIQHLYNGGRGPTIVIFSAKKGRG